MMTMVGPDEPDESGAVPPRTLPPRRQRGRKVTNRVVVVLLGIVFIEFR
jgi:hypothetical protein